MYENFERLMKAHGVSAYRVAKDTGIAQSVLSSWKTGVSKPKPDKLRILADYFGVSLDYLINGESVISKPHHENTYPPLTKVEIELLKAFSELNELGRKHVLSYAQDMLKIEEYCSYPSNSNSAKDA